jgi:1-acyl-sn-glycerol-3-phosphate acyltransferase
VRKYLVFCFLIALKSASRLFYRVEMDFVGEPPPDPWRRHRLVAVLNHTSLYEALFAGGCPNHFLWRLAAHGVVPIAQKTADRPLVGRFYKTVAGNVIPISRERDETWAQVLRTIDPDCMVVLFPEGRMKRASGLDAEGKPMSVRAGIADLLEEIGEGRMLLAYSGGLHHVQIPGQKLPRLFRTLRMRLEVVDIAEYRSNRLAEGGKIGYRRAVVNDLERRRDALCPAAAPAA